MATELNTAQPEEKTALEEGLRACERKSLLRDQKGGEVTKGCAPRKNGLKIDVADGLGVHSQNPDKP